MERERFTKLLDSQPLSKGDVILVLQGDGLNRAPYAAKLFQDGYASLIAIIGSARDQSYGSYPSSEVRSEMIRRSIPASAIYFEESGPNTRGEAVRTMNLAKEKGWRTVLIVTSPHHQYRAFLTFLKAMQDAKLELKLVNAVAPLSWTEKTPWGVRLELLRSEFDKIELYQKKGDVATYKAGILYLGVGV